MKSNINCFLVRVLIILFFAAIPGQLCARGGGGCFLAGTPILLADGSKKNIEDIRIGDRLLTSSSEGVAATAAVRNIFSLDVDEYLEVRIDGMMLRVTREHPFCAGNGQFRTIGSLTAGDTVYAFNGSSLEKKKILSITTVREKAIVYNLSADQPNTFVAGGILVHNKGGGHGGGGHGGGSHSGGGFGGGYHGGFSGRTSGSSASSGDAPDEGTAVLVVALFFFIGYVLYKVIIAGEPGSSEKKEPNGSNGIDRLVDAKSIERRAVKARMILEKIDPLEKGFEEQNLKSVVKKAFLTLQKAWEARDYGPMSGLATKSLRARHEAQIEGLKRNHEINKIDDLAIQGIEIVQVCYAPDRKIREFAAWIDATARDFYIDDRSRSYLRGDTYRARFQEIYVFRMDAGGAWLLSGIEQTKETRKLNSKNLFKPQSAASSGKTTIAQSAQAAPRDAHTRIERELDKLARHDASWSRELMTDFASTLATKVYMHREGGPFPPTEALSDEMAAMLEEEDKSRKKDGISVEFRNFCVRECHVSSYRMSACPEFTASISIHAQCRVLRNGVITHEDEDLRVFIERWTFRKTARNWMLAKITAKNRDSAPV